MNLFYFQNVFFFRSLAFPPPQPQPVVLSINPSSGNPGTTITAIVTGTNFTPDITFSFAPGTILVSSIVVTGSTMATMTLTISSSATGSFNLTGTSIFGASTLNNAFVITGIGIGDFFDYIFQFPDQGSFLRDPTIQLYAPSVLGSQPGVQLLIYNPVETLSSRAKQGNSLVFAPQQANSSVALPGFWAMLTIQSQTPIPSLRNHSNIQIVNDRTLMFAQQPSVVLTKIDVSHINIVINIFGVYVTDGLRIIGLLLEDDTSSLLLEDGTSVLLLEG